MKKLIDNTHKELKEEVDEKEKNVIKGMDEVEKNIQNNINFNKEEDINIKIINIKMKQIIFLKKISQIS